MQSANKPLTEEEFKLIDEVKEKLSKRVKNGCTSCKYCMPCPKGVNIPRMFRMWNTASMYENFNIIRWAWTNTKEEEMATNCIKCGLCETKCPQAIEIRKDLENAYNYIVELSKK